MSDVPPLLLDWLASQPSHYTVAWDRDVPAEHRWTTDQDGCECDEDDHTGPRCTWTTRNVPSSPTVTEPRSCGLATSTIHSVDRGSLTLVPTSATRSWVAWARRGV